VNSDVERSLFEREVAGLKNRRFSFGTSQQRHEDALGENCYWGRRFGDLTHLTRVHEVADLAI
jgi:hypothetical protein